MGFIVRLGGKDDAIILSHLNNYLTLFPITALYPLFPQFLSRLFGGLSVWRIRMGVGFGLERFTGERLLKSEDRTCLGGES